MRLIAVLGIVALLAGCGKRSDTSTPVAASSNQPALAPAAATPATADMGAALGELTQALRKYCVEQRRVPKTFSEVVAAGYVKSMPNPPPGMKFAIDEKRMQVVLVKQ